MNIELKSELENRLRELAMRESISVDELVNRIVAGFVESMSDLPEEWVKTTQQQLTNVWPIEDFSDWQPPDA